MLEQLTLKKAVEFAIKTEEIGAAAYAKLARKFSDEKDIEDIFQVLAREEIAHGKAFTTLLMRVPDVEESEGAESWQYLRAMSISQFFSGREGLLKSLDKIQTREDALVRAISLEKATLQFYDGMRDLLDDSEIIDSIIRAEKRHIVNLMRVLMSEGKLHQISEPEDDAFGKGADDVFGKGDDDPGDDDAPPPKRKDNITFG